MNELCSGKRRVKQFKKKKRRKPGRSKIDEEMEKKTKEEEKKDQKEEKRRKWMDGWMGIVKEREKETRKKMNK